MLPIAALRVALTVCLLALSAVAAAAPAQAAPRSATHIVQLRGDVALSEGPAIVRAAGGRVEGSLPIIRGLAARLPAGARAPLMRDSRVAAVTRNARVLDTSTLPLGDEEAAAEQPAAGAAGEEPVAAEEPAAGVASEEPVAAEEPAAGAASEEPVAAEEPIADAVSEGPVAADAPASEESAPEPSVEQPAGADGLATAYPYSVFAPQAWDLATGAGVGVAVIDTGIDGALPDFAGADGASRVIASATTNPGATTANDTYGHGTHVAGIIAGDGTRRAGDDPAAGKYAGIAPEANLISVKIDDDDGHATVLDAIYGLQFVVDHRDDYNIRVVNLSLESTVQQSYKTDPLDAAVESAYFHGILVVVAAGNQGPTPEAANYAPGNDPFALSVGAVDDQETRSRADDAYTEWSSAGRTQDGFDKPEIAAPGAHIVSTLARGSAFASLCPTCVVDGEYIRAGGTSMAAPVVSGVAALMLERHPEWTPDEVKSTLIATARNLDGGVDEVNAFDAVAARMPDSGVNDGIVPNELVDAASGEIDYTRSSWSRSSWSSAPESLIAGWTRSSWSCTCSTSDESAVDPTRSSWSRSSWSRSSWSAKWTY